MINKYNKKDYHLKIYSISIIILFISYIIGFVFGENATGGKIDHQYIKEIIEGFTQNFKDYLQNYQNRHSPVFYILISFFKKINLSIESIRFFHFCLSLTLIYCFYKCLEIKFEKLNKIILLAISSLILLSPNFRTLSIWPQPIILATIFFVISIYFFLKFQKSENKNEKFKYALINNVLLIISAYISPNFSIFIIYFFYHYFLYFNLRKKILYLLLLNIFFSLPAFYYLFGMEKYLNFFYSVYSAQSPNYSGLAFNLSNKILIICSIIFFHLMPFIVTKSFKISFDFYKKNILMSLVIFILFLFFAFTFNFQVNYGGGGIFFTVSNYLFNNNILFYLCSFVALMTIFQISYKNFNNFLLFLVLVLLNPQLSIYHKYYDPLIIILVFTIFSSKINMSYLNKKKNIFFVGSYSLFFLILNFTKHYLN